MPLVACAIRRIRVLWLIKGLGPGGAERLLVSAAAEHDRQSFDIETAYLLRWKQALVPELEALGVPTHCLDVDTPADVRWVYRLHRLLRDGRFDVVHLHSPLPAGVARLLVRALPPHRYRRLVTTEHNEWPTYSLGTRLLNGLTMPLDDADFAVSPSTRRAVWKPLRNRIEVLVHGVPLGAARAASAGRARVRAEWGVGDDEVVIGAVANYRPQKGYPDLLSAARTVIDEGLPVRFVAIGQGPLEGEIKRRHAELALGDRFRLLGYHPNPFAVLAGCDVFVMASLYEGYSVALMEALAMALPVVATAVGGVPDAIGDGKEGLIVPPGRPELLARALLELVGDAERRKQMASAAWARAARYDIGVAVRRIESAYRDVCNA